MIDKRRARGAATRARLLAGARELFGDRGYDATSIEAVLLYLRKVDPEAAERARYRYGCFEDFGEDPQAYGYAASFDLSKSCEQDAIKQLVELQQRKSDYMGRDGRLVEDEFFYAEQNARLVKDAEEYYRTMFSGQVSSWNLRDRHMAETLDALVAHLEQQRGSAKLVVWEHNSHLGDARATSMGADGEPFAERKATVMLLSPSLRELRHPPRIPQARKRVRRVRVLADHFFIDVQPEARGVAEDEVAVAAALVFVVMAGGLAPLLRSRRRAIVPGASPR